MANDPRPMVLMTIHKMVKVGDQYVTQHVNEWVPADDPRLPRNGDVTFERGPVLDASEPQGAAAGITASESSPTIVEPAVAEDSALQPAQTVHEPHTPTALPTALATVVAAPTEHRCEALATTVNIPKREPQREVNMPERQISEDAYEEEDYDAAEDDDDDRPWKITRQTFAEIDRMAPSELQALIDNIDAHEEWDDLRETAKQRTAQRLAAIKKAKAAPRCEFVKMNGEKCGSPAMKGEATCYNHGQAHAKRQAEEAAKILDAPILDTRVSVQVAITRVCSLLATGSIDDKRARALISALRLAHRNLGEAKSVYLAP